MDIIKGMFAGIIVFFVMFSFIRWINNKDKILEGKFDACVAEFKTSGLSAENYEIFVKPCYEK